jgi:hypothetical protein
MTAVAGRLATTASIAIVAYAAMDMCHEVLGHGVATLFPLPAACCSLQVP